MRAHSTLLVCLVATLAGCGEGAKPILAGAARPAPLAVFDPGPLAPPLLAYTWEGEGTVPVPPGGLDRPLVFGEIGRSPETLVYLPTLGSPDDELRSQPGWTVAAHELEAGPGYFGPGLALASDTRVEFTPEERAGVPALAWTIEFWIKPEELRDAVIVSLPGLLEVQLDSVGRIAARTVCQVPEGVSGRVATKSSAGLEVGTWNHVGVVLDPGYIGNLRVVTNGVARSEALKGPLPERATSFVIGAASGELPTLRCALDELRLQGRAANTSELEAHWRATPAPLQRLTLEHAAGRETRELWTTAIREPELAAGSDWTRGTLEHLRLDADGLVFAPADWQRIPAVDPPLARTTAPVVEVGDETLFLFSGEVRDSHYGRAVNSPDTWLFDMRAGAWTQLDLPVAPPGRCHQMAAYSPEHDVVLMVGGWDNEVMPGTLLSDLWLFHVKERRWEKREPQGVPERLSDSTVIYHPELRRFVILAVNQLFTYDPGTDVFARVGTVKVDRSAAPGPEQPAGGPVAGLDPRTGLVWLFGGSRWENTGEDAHEVFSDDLAYLDVRTRKLTYVDVPRPSARVRAALAWDPRHARFVFFGGVREQGSERFDDLWTFAPDERRWTELDYAGGITRRGGYYGMGYSPEQDRFFLLTGRHSRERFLEDSWTLSLPDQPEGRARYLFDRAELAPGLVWFAELEAGDGRAEFRFRASDDGRTFDQARATCPSEGRFVEVELVLAPGPSGVPPRVRALGFRAP